MPGRAYAAFDMSTTCAFSEGSADTAATAVSLVDFHDGRDL
jgi:hypothetical protein